MPNAGHNEISVSFQRNHWQKKSDQAIGMSRDKSSNFDQNHRFIVKILLFDNVKLVKLRKYLAVHAEAA